MKTTVFLFLAVFTRISTGSENNCGFCDPATCPTLETTCPAGIVRDECNCCNLCGIRDSEPCGTSVPRPDDPDVYVVRECGEGLKCVKDEDPDKTGSVCRCADPQRVCGSNNVTYDNICAMREQASTLPQDKRPTLERWGPCAEAPKIVTLPEAVNTQRGTKVSMGCEAMGWPVPVINWERTGQDGKKVLLPGDTPRIAVLQRGGPEPMMVSGWVQLMDVEPEDAGTYKCIAMNEHGETEATSTIGVYKGWDEDNEV